MHNNRHFLIPMVVSILLLPGFIAYFLFSEYKKEEQAILLEEKDESMSKFLDELDILTENEILRADRKLLSFERDSSGEQVKFEFKLESVDPNIRIDSLINSEPNLDIEIFENEENIAFDIKGEIIDSHIAIVPDLMEMHTNENAKRSKVIAQNSVSIVRKSNLDITPIMVLLRMLPQIIFSVFLLLSVFLAYWFIAKSLRKERDLAMLRNNFISNMSHELKTPVSTIGVALEALSNFDAADNPNLRKEYIDISKNEVERLGILVEKALNISLYEQGRFVLDIQRIALDQTIKKTLESLKVQLENQHVTIQFHQSGDEFDVDVDLSHMVNVIYNLIENAVKYSLGQTEIDLYLESQQKSILLTISDNGPGIEPQYQDKIFDKFFRVPQGDTHNVKGHGLGLSYVKEAIEAMGGTISLKSGKDTGSSFIIKLPRSEN